MESINMYAVGIDVGGTAIKIGLFEKNGRLVDKKEIPTRHENNCEFVFSDMAEAVKEVLKNNSVKKKNVSGIGIGMPGPVVNNVVQHCVNLGWQNKIDAAGITEKLTGIKTVVLNDADAAGYGELWQGSAKSYKNVVLVTIGTGVGGAVINEGVLIEGFGGSAGEIGHMTVEMNSKRHCNCGKNGCLETYASATGIVRTAEELLDSGEKSVLTKENLTARDIFDAEKNGDNVALKTVDVFGKYLGMALANIAVVTNPEIILLSGGVAYAGEIVTDIVKKYFDVFAFKSVKNTEIKIASLKNEAGIYGAAYAAIKKWL